MQFGLFGSIACAFLGVVSAVADAEGPVLKLTTENFDQYVDGSKPAMVKFFAPWCGHCKTLAPIYNNLAKGFPQSKVVIAEVNTDEQRDLAKRFGIKGLPTLFWFEKGGDLSAPEKYSGGRDLSSLSKFISGKTGLKGTAREAGSYVVDLNSRNYNSYVNDPSKNVLVDFYAPWCGHCKKLAPIYEQLAEVFKNDPNCVIAKVNGDDNKDIIKSERIRGYPTVKMFPAGNGKTVMVEDRSLNGLVAAVNRFCGTKRTAKGKLSKSAGVVTDMDEAIKQFVKNPASMQKDTIAKFSQEKSGGPNAELLPYAFYMEKIQKAGLGFIAKEFDRLTALINADSVDSKKADEFTIRRNVLAVFAQHADIEIPQVENEDLIADENTFVPDDEPVEEVVDEASKELL